MKRKLATMLGLIATCFLLAGCTAGGLSSNAFSYEDFSFVVSSPANLSNSMENDWLNKKVTFIAMKTSDIFQAQSDSDSVNGTNYMGVSIARNVEKEIFINVDGLESVPEADYYEITGTVDGYLYTAGNAGTSEYLDIKATEIKAYTPEEKEVQSDGAYINENTKVSYEPVKAQKTMAAGDKETILLYYNIESNSDGAVINYFTATGLFAFQGDDLLTTNNNFLQDKSILDSNAVPPHTLPQKGMKLLTYATFETVNDSNEIYICAFDDTFSLVYEKLLTVE